jgi:ABC-2 type transport system permease protein
VKAFSFRRAWTIARKEGRHIVRDPFTLGLAIGLPMIMLIFFGFAIDFDVRDVHLTVFDRDNTRPSRQFVDTIRGTGLFKIKQGFVEAGSSGSRASLTEKQISADLDHEVSKGVLVIEQGFGDDLRSGRSPHAQLLLDGADNSAAGVVAAYLSGIVPAAWLRLTGQDRTPPPVELKTRFLFNGELNSRWFVIPGLGVLIMGLLATLLTATTVAREWENGSMELLLSTPVKPLEIIVGKLLPYLGLGFGAVMLIYVAARLVFGLPFVGSHALYIVGCLLFLIPCLSMGLLVSVATRQQQMAMQMSMMITMLPSMMLSGFIFPVESMPVFFGTIANLIPATWFIVVSRGLYLKGAGFSELAIPFLILVAMNVFFVWWALKQFKTDLEP